VRIKGKAPGGAGPRGAQRVVDSVHERRFGAFWPGWVLRTVTGSAARAGPRGVCGSRPEPTCFAADTIIVLVRRSRQLAKTSFLVEIWFANVQVESLVYSEHQIVILAAMPVIGTSNNWTSRLCSCRLCEQTSLLGIQEDTSCAARSLRASDCFAEAQPAKRCSEGGARSRMRVHRDQSRHCWYDAETDR